MDRLRGRFNDALRELERLSQQEAASPRPVSVPPRPMKGSPPDREGQDAEPQAWAAASTPLTPPAASARPSGPNLRAALGSRAALRQAFLLRELLGPPRALQDPRDEGRR